MEAAGLIRSAVFRGEGVEDARGQPVMLIPGFLAGDDSLGLMTQWLRRTGHYTRSAGMRANVNCSELALERLGDRLRSLAERHTRRLAIVGQSRGGSLAKVLAMRHPELVSGVVALGSPQLGPLELNPLVQIPIHAVGALGTLGIPGFFRRGCRSGDCCERYWEDLRAPLSDEVGYVSIYSRSDGVVNWRACLDPGAEHVEVQASHVGMAMNADAYSAIARALASFRATEAARRRSRFARREGVGRRPVRGVESAA